MNMKASIMAQPQVCECCLDGEHELCEEPKETRMERDTGWHHVVSCCCGGYGDPDDYDGPDIDYDDVPPWFDRD